MVRRTRRHEGRAQYRAMKCVHVSADNELWGPRYEAFRRGSGDIVKHLQSLLHESMHIDAHDEPDGSGRLEERMRRQRAAIEEALSFYSSGIHAGSFIARMLRGELETVIALDGFTPFPVRGTRVQSLPEEAALMRYGARGISESRTLDVGAIAGMAGRLLDEALDRLFPMGPFRRPPERWYIFTGTSPHDVGYKGELLPDLLFRSPELVQKANSWLNRLQIGYQLEVRPVGTRSRICSRCAFAIRGESGTSRSGSRMSALGLVSFCPSSSRACAVRIVSFQLSNRRCISTQGFKPTLGTCLPRPSDLHFATASSSRLIVNTWC